MGGGGDKLLINIGTRDVDCNSVFKIKIKINLVFQWPSGFVNRNSLDKNKRLLLMQKVQIEYFNDFFSSHETFFLKSIAIAL